MLLDIIIVLIYFTAIMIIAMSGRVGKEATVDEYFLSSRNLRWPSIAISTIATNVQGYQFLGMMGSAYVYGLAQANWEINAMQGILMAAFIFVPLYLKDKVITITQFIKTRLGATVALLYSCANISIFSTLGLGAALFWGAYAADMIFSEYLSFISDDNVVRIYVLIIALGIFSAVYTYFGGLAAVVKTDIIQFSILTIGGIIVLIVAIKQLGGWSQLYEKTPQLMHLHLPADHEKIPWIAIGGMFLLNINYWCANQSVVQRSLAAKSLKEAQIGLMVGGVMKYFMAIIIIIPGIALAGIMVDAPLQDPDNTFPYLVKAFLPQGMRGIILCALFASLMSTVDSTFNSLATLFSIDIYKEYINKNATETQIVNAGRNTILVTLMTGITMGCILAFVKFKDPSIAFTHTLNELRYFINTGIVTIICAAAFLVTPKHRPAIFAFLFTIPLHLIFMKFIPDMNYIVRAMWVILIAFAIIAIPTVIDKKWKPAEKYLEVASKNIGQIGFGLLVSLGVLHFVFS